MIIDINITTDTDAFCRVLNSVGTFIYNENLLFFFFFTAHSQFNFYTHILCTFE
jgi:hypothetical protein